MTTEEKKKEVIKILRSFFVDGGKSGNDETWGVPERAEEIMKLFKENKYE